MIDRNKRILYQHVLYLTVICVYILIITVFEIGCPLKFFFRTPCPGCGGTRAMLSLLRLDFKGYLYYHALALPLAGAIWTMLHIKLFRRKKKIYIGVFLILGMNLLYYYWRFPMLKDMI